MSKIHAVNTKPEFLLRRELWKLGFRYRLNVKNLKGKPDVVFNKHKVIVFIDGEFWHGYKWSEKKLKIKANRKYWISKIEGNMKRDIENTEYLMSLGYSVFRFWEHEIKKDLSSCVDIVTEELRKNG